MYNRFNIIWYRLSFLGWKLHSKASTKVGHSIVRQNTCKTSTRGIEPMWSISKSVVLISPQLKNWRETWDQDDEFDRSFFNLHNHAALLNMHWRAIFECCLSCNFKLRNLTPHSQVIQIWSINLLYPVRMMNLQHL